MNYEEAEQYSLEVKWKVVRGVLHSHIEPEDQIQYKDDDDHIYFTYKVVLPGLTPETAKYIVDLHNAQFDNEAAAALIQEKSKLSVINQAATLIKKAQELLLQIGTFNDNQNQKP